MVVLARRDAVVAIEWQSADSKQPARAVGAKGVAE